MPPAALATTEKAPRNSKGLGIRVCGDRRIPEGVERFVYWRGRQVGNGKGKRAKEKENGDGSSNGNGLVRNYGDVAAIHRPAI